MNNSNVTAVILAAGKGTRMKSAHAKVLHHVSFKPMLHHVLDAVVPLGLVETVLVTGHQFDKVEASCAGYDVSFARQTEQLGTGHAVLSAQQKCALSSNVILILCGDTPLIRFETLQQMLSVHMSGSRTLTVMTTDLDDPSNYGRIITDEKGLLESIVEEKDASDEQKAVNEINAGIYCVDKDFLFAALAKVGTDNMQGEVYLTDIVSIACMEGHAVHRFVCEDAVEVLGVNSRVELSRAHSILQTRLLEKYMNEGVSFNLPETTSIHEDVVFGQDTLVHANVTISGQTSIGCNCVIHACSNIVNCVIGDYVTIGSGSYMENAHVTDNKTILPHSKLFTIV